MKQQEHLLQVACVQWLKAQWPQVLCFHPANGGYRTKSEAGRLKAAGVVAGIPDLFIPVGRYPHPGTYRRQPFYGLWIELKTPKNKPTESQSAIHDKLRKEGYKVEVIRSLDEFINVVNEYLR